LHFRPAKLLVGDYIERYNLLAESGGNLEKAGKLAMLRAEPIKKIIACILGATANCNSMMISSEGIVSSPLFREFLESLQRQFQQETAFRDVVLEDVNDYVRRMETRGKALRFRAEITDPMVSYILEELAVFSALAKQGLSVQIYPGRHLKVLIKLAEKRINSPVLELNNLKCIELSLSH
jgi:tRNA-dependent cyclodipeptide synthase